MASKDKQNSTYTKNQAIVWSHDNIKPISNNDSSIMSESSTASNIPEDLRKLLIDFSLACLLEQPKDYIDYGVNYFRRVQMDRRSSKQSLQGIQVPSTMSLVKVGSKYFGKREKRNISLTSLYERNANYLMELAERKRNKHPDRRSSFYVNREDDFTEDDDEDHESSEEIEIDTKTDEQRLRIRKYIDKVLNFRQIDENVMKRAIAAMYERHVAPGECILKSGSDISQNFYIIQSGKFNIYIDEMYAYSYLNEGCFGEMALLHKGRVTRTVIAETAGVLWVMSGATFQRIVQINAFKKLKNFETLLESVPILKVLKKRELLNLADALIPRFYKKDDIIIKQGEQGDGMYFIEDGQVSVMIARVNGQGEQYIKSLYRGAYFGEIALLTNGPRMASLYAETDTTLAFLEKEAFERLLGKCIDLLKRGMKEYKDPNLKKYIVQFDTDSTHSK